MLLVPKHITRKGEDIKKKFGDNLNIPSIIYSDILETNDIYLRKYNTIVVENYDEEEEENSAVSATLSLSLIIIATLRCLYV